MNCDKCHKKIAVIKSGFSNKNYCLECYLSELEKKVKRNISALKLKGMVDHVFVPFHPMFPFSSLLLYKIVEKIEKKFMKTPFLLVITNDKNIEEIQGEIKKVFIINVEDEVIKLLEKKKKQGITWYWRLLRGIYVSSIKSFHSSIMILPGCADFLAFLDLYSIITNEEKSEEDTPVLSFLDDGPGIVNGFYGIPCNEVISISYLVFKRYDSFLKISDAIELNRLEAIIYKMLLDSVRDKSYEALINIEKAFSYVSTIQNYKKCKYCRGASLQESCMYCKELEKYYAND